MEFYHDYSALGLSLQQRGGIYPANQRAKAPVISGYLMFALGKLKSQDVSPLRVTELFCADAYYSFLALRFGADHCVAIDIDRDGHLAEAAHIKAALQELSVDIVKNNIFDLDDSYQANIVLNTGGLYHVSDPLKALDISYRLATDYLIVQSVVSLANERPDYFESPVPERPDGCRFSHQYLEAAIKQRGWNVIDSERNILTGNDRPEDRGSSYYLISKAKEASDVRGE